MRYDFSFRVKLLHVVDFLYLCNDSKWQYSGAVEYCFPTAAVSLHLQINIWYVQDHLRNSKFTYSSWKNSNCLYHRKIGEFI